jgi:opacity protein-like surface antigen
MRRAICVLTLAVLAVWPRPSSAGNLDLRVGAFFPRADSDLFADDSDLYVRDGQRLATSDWVGWAGGIAYNSKLADNIEIGVSLDGYGKKLHTSYLAFTDETTGGEIRQNLELAMVPVGVSLRLVPTRRSARVAPFVEIGPDLVFYEYKEEGDFLVDPGDVNCVTRDGCNVYPDLFKSTGAAFGFHAAGGVRVAVSDDVSVVGQYRYYFVGRPEMGDDFGGFHLDLNGGMATFGFNVRF